MCDKIGPKLHIEALWEPWGFAGKGSRPQERSVSLLYTKQIWANLIWQIISLSSVSLRVYINSYHIDFFLGVSISKWIIKGTHLFHSILVKLQNFLYCLCDTLSLFDWCGIPYSRIFLLSLSIIKWEDNQHSTGIKSGIEGCPLMHFVTVVRFQQKSN